MAEMSGQGANQRGFDEHYKNTKKVTVYFYSTANDIPVRVSSSNPLPVSATIDTTGLATTTTDTNTTAISTNIGAKADASATTDTGTFSLISLFKRLLEKVTTLVAKDFSTSAKQDTIIGHVDGIEGLLTTIDTDTGTIATEVAGLLTDTELRATPVPVSGTVAATQSGTWTEANSAAIKTAVETIDNAISGSEMQVDVITMPTVTTTETVPSTIYNGKTTVTTAGTRVVLAAAQAVKSVTIKALSTNTGLIYVGSNAVASTNGFQLSAGETISMDIADLNTVNIDSAVNGEGVTYIGVN